MLLPWMVAGCRQENAALTPSPSPGVVATVEASSITQDELADAMEKRARALGRAPMTAALKQAVLEELIQEKVLLAKAKAAGVDRDPELVRRWERMVAAHYEATHLPEPSTQAAPSDAEVQAFYQAHLADYAKPARIRAAIIHLKGSTKATDDKRAELRARAQALLSQAQSPDVDFTDLARRHSDDRATRYTGGDHGWMERTQTPLSWPPALIDAAFALKQSGSFAPLIEAEGSVYILKLIDRQEAGVRALAEVQGQIAHQLMKQQRLALEERFHAEQRAGLKIDIHTAALEAVPLPSSTVAQAPGAPPALPLN